MVCLVGVGLGAAPVALKVSVGHLQHHTTLSTQNVRHKHVWDLDKGGVAHGRADSVQPPAPLTPMSHRKGKQHGTAIRASVGCTRGSERGAVDLFGIEAVWTHLRGVLCGSREAGWQASKEALT